MNPARTPRKTPQPDPPSVGGRGVTVGFRFGPFEFRTSPYALKRDGQALELQPQPAALLELLLSHGGEIVSRQVIRDYLWPEDPPANPDRAINITIRQIRAVLNDDPQQASFIETLPRRGYRIVVPVRGIEAETSTDGKGGPAPRRWAWLIAGVLAILLALGWRWRDGARLPGATAERPSVVVLGFQNLSDHPADDWIATALEELLATELEISGNLRVLPVESVARMRRDLTIERPTSLSAETLDRVAQYLVGDYVISGSYLLTESSVGRSLRVDYRLQDTVSGETLATHSANGRERDLASLVIDHRDSLRRALGLESPGEAVADVSGLPTQPATVKLFARGLASLRRYALHDARDLLLEAKAAEGDSPRLLLALSEVWAELGHRERAVDAARRAHELSIGMPDELRTRIEARYREMEGAWEAAEALYQGLWTVFSDNPEYGLRLAAVQRAAGKPRQAFETLDRLRAAGLTAAWNARVDLEEARVASGRGAWQRQVAAAGRAVQAADTLRAELLLVEASILEVEALEALGRGDEAAASLSRARSVAEDRGFRRDVARALLARNSAIEGRVRIAPWMGHDTALEVFRRIGDRQGEARTMLQQIRRMVEDPKLFSAAEEQLVDVFEMAEELSSQRLTAEASNVAAELAFARGDPSVAKRHARAAVDAAREADHQVVLGVSLQNLGVVLHVLGQLDEVDPFYGEAIEIFRQVGSRAAFSSALTNAGWLWLERGQVSRSRDTFSEALALGRDLGNADLQADAHRALINVLVELGEYGEARKHGEQAMALFKSAGQPDIADLVGLTLAFLNVYALDLPAAEAGVRQILERQIEATPARVDLWARVILCEVHFEQGQLAAARSILGQIRQRIPRENPALRRALRIIGARVDAAIGRGESAVRDLRELAEELRHAGLLVPELEARTALAEVLIQTGELAAARETIDSIVGEARALGLVHRVALAEGVRHWLEAGLPVG